MVKKYTFWNEEMLNFIRRNSDKLTSKEIAVKLGTSEHSVSNACSRYKIKKDGGTILKNKYKNGIFVGVNKGKKLLYLTKRNLENNPMKNPEVRKKAKKSIKEGFGGGRKVWNKDLIGNDYLKHYEDGIWLIEKQKDKNLKKKWIEKSLKTKKERDSMPKGKKHHLYGKTKEDSELLRKNSERMLNGGALKARKANRVKPNKPEKIIINLVKQYNLNFIYVGNSKKWFKGETQSFNPDFINEDKKKIVEFFGKYWHENTKEDDKERLKTYSQYGYKTLVIWENELRNIDEIKTKIENFTK